jgi:hypothetical protein
MSNSNLVVIVRGSYERTESNCYNLLVEVFGYENVLIVRETPFSKSIEVSFIKGLESGKEWLLCIDADVLIEKNGLLNLIEKAKSLPEHVFEIQGLIFDKFFPVFRPAGNHLFRLKYAQKAIDCIPIEGTSLRPETDMLNKMVTLGHPWVQCDAIVGIHDFEQHNIDIFRKNFLQAHKHKYIIDKAEAYWQTQKNDEDFVVAYLASQFGKKYNNTVFVDKKFLKSEMLDCLKQNNIVDKKDLEINYALKDIESIISNAIDKLDEEFQQSMFRRELWNRVVDEIKLTPAITPTNYQINNSFFLRLVSFAKRKINSKLKLFNK